jgi:hypothetical protein
MHGHLMGSPTFVIIHGLQVEVKYYPWHRSIKLWQLHHNGACSSVPAALASYAGLCTCQLLFELLTCGFQSYQNLTIDLKD